MKKIVVLGSTGSIGVSALDVISRLGPDYEVVALAAKSNAELALSQAKKFGARYLAVTDPAAAKSIKGKIPPGMKLLPPALESLSELASLKEADVVVHGLSGSTGFLPLAAALKAGKTVALANKEPMVMAGAAFMREASRWGAKIIPVDSEPSAIFQCISGGKGAEQISRIFLTASGGPFFKRKTSLDKVSPTQAVNHPRWKMGPKISVDSATLMNKGFEAIEIMNLFSLPLEKIRVVIHPQSIIHSAVEFSDGSVLAQLSLPDMRLPIQYALTWPQRRPSPLKPLELAALGRLDFGEPDLKKFPCLALALFCAKKGGGFPAVLSSADEAAVELFLSGKIKFTDIARLVEAALSAYSPSSSQPLSLCAAAELDGWAREKTAQLASAGTFNKVKGKRKCLVQF